MLALFKSGSALLCGKVDLVNVAHLEKPETPPPAPQVPPRILPGFSYSSRAALILWKSYEKLINFRLFGPPSTSTAWKTPNFDPDGVIVGSALLVKLLILEAPAGSYLARDLLDTYHGRVLMLACLTVSLKFHNQASVVSFSNTPQRSCLGICYRAMFHEKRRVEYEDRDDQLIQLDVEQLEGEVLVRHQSNLYTLFTKNPIQLLELWLHDLYTKNNAEFDENFVMCIRSIASVVYLTSLSLAVELPNPLTDPHASERLSHALARVALAYLDASPIAHTVPGFLRLEIGARVDLALARSLAQTAADALELAGLVPPLREALALLRISPSVVRNCACAL